MTTRSNDNFGHMDTSVNDSSNLTDFTTSHINHKENHINKNKKLDDSFAFLAPKLMKDPLTEAPNADWSFSYR